MSVASNLEVQMGAGVTAFNYAEYDDDNIFLDGETGFTLIEIMVVMVILGILAAAVVPNILNTPQKARI